jgi:hypothetical protein
LRGGHLVANSDGGIFRNGCHVQLAFKINFLRR